MQASPDGCLFVIFSDPSGLPVLRRFVDKGEIGALVVASIRPDQFEEMTVAAAELGVELLHQPRHEDPLYPAFVDRLRALRPRVILANSYSMLMRDDVLAVPDVAVNVHSALLPQYRGPNPLQWALINDEPETGVTMHVMTTAFDQGPIVAQRRTPIGPEETWKDVTPRLESLTEQILAEQIALLRAGVLASVPQDEDAATIFNRRRPEDGHFAWDAPLLDIYNLIRALVAPLPGAVSEDGEVFSSWTSLPALAAEKHRRRHDLRPRWGDVVLTACPPFGGQRRQTENAAIAFSVGPVVGDLTLELDWDRRRCRVQQVISEPVQRVVTAFVDRELGWSMNAATSPAER